MRKLLSLLLLFASFSAAFCGDDFLGTRSSRFKDADYNFDLTRSALARAAHWERDAEYPPLSPRKARQIALDQAKSLRPEVTNWRLDRISLEPIGDADWIYLVTYQDFSGPIFGVAWSLQIPVYFDGATIQPKIRKFKP